MTATVSLELGPVARMKGAFMKLFTAIKERYSYRGSYAPQTVPEDDLKKIVQAQILPWTNNFRQHD